MPSPVADAETTKTRTTQAPVWKRRMNAFLIRNAFHKQVLFPLTFKQILKKHHMIVAILEESQTNI